MALDQVIIFVLTYAIGMALNKWPTFKNEYIPRILWVVAVIQQAIAGATKLVTTTPIVNTSFFASMNPVAPVPAGLPTDVTAILVGTKIWIGTQILHLGLKFVKDVLKVKLPKFV